MSQETGSELGDLAPTLDDLGIRVLAEVTQVLMDRGGRSVDLVGALEEMFPEASETEVAMLSSVFLGCSGAFGLLLLDEAHGTLTPEACSAPGHAR